jgi:pimeloyl-ACP methyl ester carboxylesterase
MSFGGRAVRSRNRLVGALVCVVAVGGGAAAGAEGDDAGGRAHERVALHPCGAIPEPEGFRCGSIRVPFERSDPSYGTTRIAFAVRRRDDRDRPSLGTIFAQEGGPGYGSTGTANAYTKLFGDRLRRHDLVLVDMRGTGLSERLQCPNLQHGLGPEWITLSDCARQLGKRFISYRTSAAADDLDAVRAALGLRRITLYGDSYGTFLAQSYAFRHGERLRALVLDSAYPAEGESPWYGSLIRTGNRALELACRRSPRCSGDAGRRLRELVEFLRKTRRGVGPLLELFGGATYGTPGSYLAIDRAGTALREGNARPWTRLTAPLKPGYTDPREYLRAGELVVGCNDYPMIWDKAAAEPERRRQLEHAIRTHPHNFGPFTPREIALSSNFGYLECLTWPAPTEVYEPPISPGDQPTTAPVLVVSGEMDNLTTPQEGRWVAQMFPNSRRFVARNAGHVDALYYRNGSAAERIREFLRRKG